MAMEPDAFSVLAGGQDVSDWANMDTDPPQPATRTSNPLNPWAPSKPKKKIKKIAGFSNKKSQEAIRN